MNTLQPGWVGLGHMGNAIVMNLQNKGFRVNVFNRTKEKEGEVVQAGAKRQENLQQLVHNSSIIFTMLTGDEAVKEIYPQLLSHSPSGKVFVDMSTVSPATSRYLAELCNSSQNEFIDAPVSGSVQPAREGKLLIMAGGPKDAFEKVKPLFDAIGKQTIYLGESGAAASAKLALNYLLGLTLQGIAETVLFAQNNGIKAEDMLGIINASVMANAMTKGKASVILSSEFPSDSALKHLVKDLRLAGEQGLQSPLFPQLLLSFENAMESGLGDEDVMAIYKYLQENKGSHPAVENIYPDDNISDYAN